MAVIRNTASQRRVGKVGSDTYYVANGQQIVRQAQNNSNYGAGASRTEAQMHRRVKWANLVNVYKACKSWMPKAFETKKSNQSDYNRFMSVNINTSDVALTKDQALNGCAVIEDLTISQGSIPPIDYEVGSSGDTTAVITDIAVSIALGDTVTVGDVAKNIIANNTGFQDGDNIALILFNNYGDGRGYPYLSSVYTELTLDTSSTAVISTKDFFNYVEFADEKLIVKASTFVTMGYTACALVHTRKISGNLYVSTQDVVVYTDTILNKFIGEEWIQTCIDTYGVDSEVPLDPSFNSAVIISVTANGSAVSQGDILNGSQVLLVTGESMASSNVKFYKDDTLYTPLATDNGAWEYILGDNGSYKLYVNGNLYLSFTISGIVVPSILPVRMQMGQKSNTNLLFGQNAINVKTIDGDCINYPYTVNAENPNYILHLVSSEVDESEISIYNCTRLNSGVEGENSTYRIVVSVEDVSKVAYITYQGFIVTVFNYSE